MIEFSVSAINNYIKNILVNDINLRSIAIEGEVCAFKEPSKNGHLYFELKDEDSRIRCVFFNILSKYDEIPFEEGDSVILEGRIDVYEMARLRVDFIGCIFVIAIKFNHLQKFC